MPASNSLLSDFFFCDMYEYTEFDRAFVQARADQYRDQLTRWQAGQLP